MRLFSVKSHLLVILLVQSVIPILSGAWETNAPNYPGSTRYEKANHGAFAALKQDGSVVTWGNPGWGGDSSFVSNSLAGGVVEIYSSGYAFAALKQNGSVVAWGDQTSGGDVSYPDTNVAAKLSSGVVRIFSTERAFAALKTNGSVVTWGDPDSGGDSTTDPLVSSQLTNGVTNIYSTEAAFAALKNDGSAVTWGDPNAGGGNDQKPVNDIFAGAKAFAFVQVGAGYTVINTYGDPIAGGGTNIGIFSALRGVAATPSAFAAFSSDGAVRVWGDTNAGGDASVVSSLLSNGVSSVISSDAAFAALKSNGTVVAWGNTEFLDTNSFPVSGYPTNLLIGVSNVVATPQAFAALKSNGTPVVWGAPINGPEGYLQKPVSGIRRITPGFGAFAALGSNGSVVTWGDEGFGGPGAGKVSTNVTSAVLHVFANDSAFAALKSNGAVVTWGDTNAGGDSSLVSNALSSKVVVLASPFLKIKGAVQVIPEELLIGNLALSGLAYSNGASITLTNIISRPYGVTNAPPAVQLSASGSAIIRTNGSGSFTIQIAGAGSVTLTASQPGDTNFRAAIPVSTSFVVDRGQQSIVFPGISTNLLVYSTNKSANPIRLALPPGSTAGIPVTWGVSGKGRLTNGVFLQMTGAGSFTLSITNSGNTNFYPLSTNWSYTIAKGAQSITLPPFRAITYTTNTNTALLAPVLPTNSSIGGIRLSNSLSGPGRITNNRILVTGAGTITLTSSNAGNADYNPVSLTTNLIVAKAAQTITFPVPAAINYINGAVTNLTALSSASLPVTLTSMNTNVVIVSSNPIVRIMTTQGSFDMELLVTNAPATVANFLRYLDAGAYKNTFFHRSVPGFITQAGGFKADSNLSAITTFPAVTNEFGLSNLRGTVAMAKLGGNPDSATSQWFVNLTNNSLNLNNQNGGFTVFARVIGVGMTNVDKIANLPVRSLGSNTPFTDLPLQGLTNGQSALFLKNLVTITNAYAYYPVTVTGAGTATIIASQSGNLNWSNAVPVTRTLVVKQAPQSIAFTSVVGVRTYATNSPGSLSIGVAASGGGAVTNFISSNTNVLALTNVDSNTVTALIRGGGTAKITAQMPARGNYLGAIAYTNIVISKAP